MAIFNAPVVGLVTAPNPFSQAPAGSLSRADNVRFVAPGVLGPRPGFTAEESGSFGAGGSRAASIGFYEDATLVHYGNSTIATNQSGSFVAYSGTYATVGDAPRMRFVGAVRCMFFNAATGVKMVAADAEPVPAGNPPGLYMTGYADSNGGATWFTGNSAVAYRYTICSIDERNGYTRVIEGAPSGQFVVRNDVVSTGNVVRNTNVVTVNTTEAHHLEVGDVVTRTEDLPDFAAGTFTVASTPTGTSFTYAETAANATSSDTQHYYTARGATIFPRFAGYPVTTGNFIRVYRSNNSATASIAPGDELFLTYESPFLTSTNISNGYLSISDLTPEALLGVPLYTNANVEGLAQSNYQPPLCEDMAYWQNRMWYANTTGLQALDFAMLGVGSPNGVQAGDTLTIAGTTYTADGDFVVITSGDPATNIELTARNLVEAININAQVAIWAYYASSESDAPGKIRVVARALTQSAFDVFASRAASWSPQFSVNAGAAYVVSSDPNRLPSGLVYSKLEQPEAVPPPNYLEIESPNEPILRIMPLNYRLLVFKTDGIYSVTGIDQQSKLSEARLIARDSVAKLGNALYALCDQGILRIDDSGPVSISVAIDDIVSPLYGAVQPTVEEYAIGVGVEAQRQYVLWLPEEEADTTNTNALVYSAPSGGWTRYTHGARSAAVSPDGHLIIGDPSANRLLVQNHSYTSDDFHDASFTVTLLSQSGTTLSLTDASDLASGDIIFDDDDIPWIIREVDDDANTVTTLGTGDFTAGTKTVHPAIDCDVRFNSITGGAPASFKLWQQASVLFRANELATARVSFETEVSQTETSVELDNTVWGQFEWGERPWGNPPPAIRRIEPLPLNDSQACQLAVSLQIAQADSKFEILGLVVNAKPDSEVNRG